CRQSHFRQYPKVNEAFEIKSFDSRDNTSTVRSPNRISEATYTVAAIGHGPITGEVTQGTASIAPRGSPPSVIQRGIPLIGFSALRWFGGLQVPAAHEGLASLPALNFMCRTVEGASSALRLSRIILDNSASA